MLRHTSGSMHISRIKSPSSSRDALGTRLSRFHLFTKSSVCERFQGTSLPSPTATPSDICPSLSSRSRCMRNFSVPGKEKTYCTALSPSCLSSAVTSSASKAAAISACSCFIDGTFRRSGPSLPLRKRSLSTSSSSSQEASFILPDDLPLAPKPLGDLARKTVNRERARHLARAGRATPPATRAAANQDFWPSSAAPGRARCSPCHRQPRRGLGARPVEEALGTKPRLSRRTPAGLAVARGSDPTSVMANPPDCDGGLT
mmetsp:Transcript_21196/g.46749  ORF Transcript_21196/g.46749 Transcript_21196/m.46749 type:complete len:259 (-) Transcript_21196:12-788(-)